MVQWCNDAMAQWCDLLTLSFPLLSLSLALLLLLLLLLRSCSPRPARPARPRPRTTISSRADSRFSVEEEDAGDSAASVRQALGFDHEQDESTDPSLRMGDADAAYFLGKPAYTRSQSVSGRSSITSGGSYNSELGACVRACVRVGACGSLWVWVWEWVWACMTAAAACVFRS